MKPRFERTSVSVWYGIVKNQIVCTAIRLAVIYAKILKNKKQNYYWNYSTSERKHLSFTQVLSD